MSVNPEQENPLVNMPDLQKLTETATEAKKHCPNRLVILEVKYQILAIQLANHWMTFHPLLPPMLGKSF